MNRLLATAVFAVLALGSPEALARGHGSFHVSRSSGFHVRAFHVRTYAHSSHYYTNVSGHRIHRPVFALHEPRGWSAVCGDGSYSFSEHHRGTCSHHGGVSRWH